MRVEGGRVRTFVGQQQDESFLAQVVDETGPLDIVIDDGSHVGPQTLVSFRFLFPRLRPGGIYVIEDMQTSYSRAHEGGPPGTTGTAASLVKELVDSVNGHAVDRGEAGPIPRVRALHVHPGIAFITRA